MTESDRSGGAYAPTPSEYETFDARDEDQDRRGWLFLGAALVVFVLFVVVVWNTFQLGVRERDSSPVIAADAEPYRVPPADPGGYEAPDQDLAVNRLREGGTQDQGDTDQTPSEPRDVREEPIDPPQRELPAARVETADADAMDEPVTQALDDTSEPEATPPTPRPAPRESQPDPVREQPVRDTPTEPVAQEPEPSSPALAAATSSGPFVAQIAAYRSSSDAESGWLSFVTRFPELASGRAPDIQRADLGERGVYHRLRIAGFATREDAAAYCEALQDNGQACLVARR